MPVVSKKVVKPPEPFEGFDSEEGLLYNLNQLTNLIDPGGMAGSLGMFTTGGYKLPKAAADVTEQALPKMIPQLKSYVWDLLKKYPVRVTGTQRPVSSYTPSLREIGLTREGALPHEFLHYIQDIMMPVGEHSKRMVKAAPRYLQDWVYQPYKKYLHRIAKKHGPEAAKRYFANELEARLLSETTYKDYPMLSSVLKRNPQLVEEVSNLEKFIQPQEAYGIHELLKGAP